MLRPVLGNAFVDVAVLQRILMPLASVIFMTTLPQACKAHPKPEGARCPSNMLLISHGLGSTASCHAKLQLQSSCALARVGSTQTVAKVPSGHGAVLFARTLLLVGAG